MKESPAALGDLAPLLVQFAARLRVAGVRATPDRVQTFVASLDLVGASDPADVYWVGRLALCGEPSEIARYDHVFVNVFGPPTNAEPQPPIQPVRSVSLAGSGTNHCGDEADDVPSTAGEASRLERLRHRDVAELTPAERADMHRILTAFRIPGDPRPTRRYRPARRGKVDRTATVRSLLRAGDEPARLRHQRHRTRPRNVVLLIDVSGSMGPYADMFLRFSHATVRGHDAPTAVFTLGTRLTDVTRPLGHRDPSLAMRAVGRAVPDWSGGTRLGDTLKEFLDCWGQRTIARGAVTVVMSDGWERGDVTLLAAQAERLGRLAHRVVWANPRAGREGFAPSAAGMAAALPFCDELLAGNTLASLEHLARVVSSAARADRQTHRQPSNEQNTRCVMS